MESELSTGKYAREAEGSMNGVQWNCARTGEDGLCQSMKKKGHNQHRRREDHGEKSAYRKHKHID
jgi:hypothetical protein